MKRVLFLLLSVATTFLSTGQCTNIAITADLPTHFQFFSELDVDAIYDSTTDDDMFCIPDGCYAVVITTPNNTVEWDIDGEVGTGNDFINMTFNPEDGCIDGFAVNYNPVATCDDGTCEYCACGLNTESFEGTCIIQANACAGPHMNFNPATFVCEFDNSSICGTGTVWDPISETCIADGIVSQCLGDLDGNSAVDIVDITIILGTFGSTCD